MSKKKTITLKIEEELLEKVMTVVKAKFPLRSIDSWAEGTREALYSFLNENQEIINKASVK